MPVRVGNQVTPQTVLTTIDQNDTLELNVQVPVERVGRVEERPAGSCAQQRRLQTTLATTTVELHLAARGRSDAVGAGEGLVPQSRRRQLRASQFVRAQIVWKNGEGLVVPVTAALRINGQYFAFVAEEAKGPGWQDGAGREAAGDQSRADLGDNYTVLDGLKPGDRVVVSGAQKLADGAPIAPQ